MVKGIDTRHADYEANFKKWKRVRDVFAGQDAVHNAGETYLQKLQDQEDADYRDYVMRAGFYNATWRTVSSLIGLMFRKSPTADIPSAIEPYVEDIDLAGCSLETFARKTSLEILGPGRYGILVDHPSVGDATPITVAAAEAQGLRPMLKGYEAERIINWRYARIRNRWQLVKVILEEDVENEKSEFEVEESKQWRVLDLDEKGHYRQRLFEKASRDDGEKEFVQIGGDVYPMIRNRPLDFVPFYILGVDGIDSGVDEPPMIDLVNANLDHYRMRADYRHGLHFTGLPTPVVSGYVPETKGEKFYIGSRSAWVFPDPQASASYLEFSGKGLSEIRDALNDLRDEMASLGARMLTPEKRQVETAEAKAIDKAGENSVLAAIAISVSSALEKALAVFAEWAGSTQTEITYQLNRDFNPAMLSPALITALQKLVQLGQMSQESFFDIMQRGDLIDADLTFEQEQERIGAADIPRPAVNDGQGMAA